MTSSNDSNGEGIIRSLRVTSNMPPTVSAGRIGLCWWLAIARGYGSPIPPACTNLTGWWCCQPTNLTQVGSSITTVGPDYGNGTGTLFGSAISIQFTNQPLGYLLNGTVAADCSTVSWDNGGAWTRSTPPWTHPSVPAPAWAYNLSILEVNALAYTSPNGTGGDGSGTWPSLTSKVAYWQSLGVRGIWLAYFSLSTAHFYGIRSVYGCLDPAQLEPSLGTADEFKAFVDACHGAGIRVFLVSPPYEPMTAGTGAGLLFPPLSSCTGRHRSRPRQPVALHRGAPRLVPRGVVGHDGLQLRLARIRGLVGEGPGQPPGPPFAPPTTAPSGGWASGRATSRPSASTASAWTVASSRGGPPWTASSQQLTWQVGAPPFPPSLPLPPMPRRAATEGLAHSDPRHPPLQATTSRCLARATATTSASTT